MDFNRKKIYFYAPGTLADGSVVISDFGSPLVQITGGSNIVFQSVNFEAGLGQGILVSNSVRNLVIGCNFRNMGNMSVDINGGGTNGVVSCNFQDLAGGGILMRGGTESTNFALRAPTHNFVVNNLITNFSRAVRVYAAAVDVGFFGPISGGGGGHYACVGTRVAHNSIANSPHCAVLHASWDNVFEYNEIHDFQQVSDDLGAFYSYDYSYQHGNQTFRYNFIHDSPVGNGIDFDQDSLAMHIYGNVMNLNTVPAESQGYGVVYHDYNQDVPGREQYADNYNNLYANTHVGARFVSPLPAVIHGNASIFCTTAFTWELVTLGVSTNTLSTSSQSVMQSGPNTNYLSDPGFLSLTNNDMRLNPASRIYTDLPTFKQIPVELIGIYNDEFRTNIGSSPFVITSNATNVTTTNAVCRGQLYFPQFDLNTTVIVYYGLTDGGSNALAWQAATNIGVFAAGSLSAAINGLQSNTNYYFRLFATNAFGTSWSASSSSLVTPPPPPFTAFTNLTPNQTVLANALVPLSGQVFNTTPLYPTNGEIISVTINGVTQTTYTTNNNGSFSLVFNTTGIPIAPGAYTITYAYGGSTNLSGTTNTSTALSIVPATLSWSGANGTNFEVGGINGNWSDYAAPINDFVSSTAIFGNPPITNQPSLSTNRSVGGLSFGATNGGWKLSGGSNNFTLGIGGNGITTAGQNNGTNFINANLNIAASQTWQAGTGGTLLFSGGITNSAAATTNYSIVFNSGANTGTVILSPSFGNRIVLTGTNNVASIFQIKSGGVTQLGGDGVNTPVTTSSNLFINSGTNAFGAIGLNAPGKIQVNSGTWIMSDLGKNGSDRLTGTLEVNGGVIGFGGARYLGEGTIQVNGGVLRVGSDLSTHFSNGGKFSLGSVFTVASATAAMNITGGFVDLALGNASSGGNSIGTQIGALLNQSGGIFQNGVTAGFGSTTNSFAIGGMGNGTTNNLTAFTLAGGTFICAGIVLAPTNAGPGSVNNFNFKGGVLAVQSFNATNLGSSPAATVLANQTNVSLSIGTLANYGGTFAPGTLGVPGRAVILGNYAVSNNAAVLAMDIGGTNPANAFQNGATNFDFVSVAGSVTLGGSLAVNLINSYVPVATNSFVILTNGGTLGGGFTNIIGGRVEVTNIPGGSFAVVTGANSLVLTNFVLLSASFTASTNAGTAPLTVTFSDTSTGLITNRFWNFGDGFTTNITTTGVTHTFNFVGTNVVSLVVSDMLASSTNSLNVIVTASSTPPVLSGVTLSGTNLIFTATNGVMGADFFLMEATNLLLPVTNWTVLSTNQFGPGGAVTFTNPLDVNSPQSFFRLRLP